MSDFTLGNWTVEDDEPNDELVFKSLNTNNELRFDNGGGFSADGSLDIPHSTTHESGGIDELNVGGLSGDLADPQDPKTHASTHSRQGSDTIEVEQLGGDDYIYARSFPGGTNEERLENALAFADGGERIYLEDAIYRSDITITDRVRIIGTERGGSGSDIRDATLTIDTNNAGISTVRFSFSTTVIINGPRVLMNNVYDVANGITINADNCQVLGAYDPTVTFASGTSGGVVDGCVGANITDNGANTIGSNS